MYSKCQHINFKVSLKAVELDSFYSVESVSGGEILSSPRIFLHAAFSLGLSLNLFE